MSTDARGYSIFCSGDAGRAHVFAHRMLDAGRTEQGGAALGRFLETHAGDGPKWIHLQWHMLVFELAADRWDAAYARYRDAIAPLVRTSAAVTDAPQALLRLCWTAPAEATLPWQALCAPATRRLEQESHPFRVLHDLLAIAGAGDLEVIDHWLRVRASGMPVGLRHAAMGLRAFSSGQDVRAARELGRVLPELSRWGGSRAQNELFVQLHHVAMERACRALTTNACLQPRSAA